MKKNIFISVRIVLFAAFVSFSLQGMNTQGHNSQEQDVPSLQELREMFRNWAQQHYNYYFRSNPGNNSGQHNQQEQPREAGYNHAGPRQPAQPHRFRYHNRYYRIHLDAQGEPVIEDDMQPAEEVESEDNEDNQNNQQNRQNNPQQVQPQQNRQSQNHQQNAQENNSREDLRNNQAQHQQNAQENNQQQPAQNNPARQQRQQQPQTEPIQKISLTTLNQNQNNQELLENYNNVIQQLRAAQFDNARETIRNNPDVMGIVTDQNKTIFHELLSVNQQQLTQVQYNAQRALLFDLFNNPRFVIIAHQLQQLEAQNTHEGAPCYLHIIYYFFIEGNEALARSVTQDEWNTLLTNIKDHYHVIHGQEKAIDFRFDKFSSNGVYNLSLLHYASRNNIPELINLLLTNQNYIQQLFTKSDFDINQRDYDGKSLIYYATRYNQAPLLSALLTFKSSCAFMNILYDQLFEHNDQQNQTTLMIALDAHLELELFKHIAIKAKSNLNSEDNLHETVLHKAIRQNRFDEVKILLELTETPNNLLPENQAEAELLNNRAEFEMMTALINSDRTSIKLATDQLYSDILYYAIYHKAQARIIDLLLKHGAKMSCARLSLERYHNQGIAFQNYVYNQNGAQAPHALTFFLRHGVTGNQDAVKTATCFIREAQRKKDLLSTQLITTCRNFITQEREAQNNNNQLNRYYFNALTDIDIQLKDLIPVTQQHERTVRQRQDDQEQQRRRLEQELQEEKDKARTLKYRFGATVAGLTCALFPETSYALASMTASGLGAVITTGASAVVTVGSWLLSCL